LQLFKKADPRKRLRTWTISALVLLAAVVLQLLASDGPALQWALLAALTVAVLLLFYLYYGLPRVQYGALRKGTLKGIQTHFIFKNDEMLVSSSADTYSGNTVMKYRMLVKAAETGAYLFLYQNNASAFVVDKSTVMGGSVEDIRRALAAALGDKYMICNY
ncbi:MAG: hypothetical protein GX558_08340, partial [Clostridiales bacterium]|nr:hypothetical protein [Clostridiales bacterium]